jgi:3-oxoacyl-[acyl-carrier protein] reductase
MSRVALVTGAARGIGAATALRLAREGAAVVLADLDPADEVAAAIADAGGTARAVACDVTRKDQVEAAVRVCVDDLGSLDVLVTSAGVLRDDLVHKLSEHDFDLVIATHLKGTFLCAQAAQREMVRAGAARWCSSPRARRAATAARRTTRQPRPGSRG